MNSRERVMNVLDFQEPDRVPIDLGGTWMSGIMAHALTRLRKYLGISSHPVRVYEIFQMLGEVEPDVLDRLSCDIVPLDARVGFFGIAREDWKSWKLWDGTEVLVPRGFCPIIEKDGSLSIRENSDPEGKILGCMPKGGFYFDIPEQTDITEIPDLMPVEKLRHRWPLVTDEELSFLAKRAKQLRSTGRAITAGLWGIGCGRLAPRRVTDRVPWLYLLAAERNYCREVMDAQSEVCIENAKRYFHAIGNNVDIVGICGEDYGAQNSSMISPEVFMDVYVPYQKKVNDWIHANTPYKTFFHCCGSIFELIEGFIEMGADILNPVQCSSTNMEPAQLKEKFGGRIVFWGGGVDTQKTLPFGTPDEVEEEVRERIEVFAPGGGYVFSPVHNIQQGVPPENIVAAYDTAIRFGNYPIGKSSKFSQ